METTKYVGKVQDDGHLFIRSNALLDLGLTVGDEIEIVLKKLRKDKVREKKQMSDESAYTFSESKLKRLNDLFYKNREGELTQSELFELERLVFEARLRTLEKAKQLYLQKKEQAEAGAFQIRELELKRPYISKDLKHKIIKQATFRCGYYQSPQHLLVVKMEIEHIIPLSQNGDSSEKNLQSCCPTCNMYKGSKINAIDPESNRLVPLFNPRHQQWSEHFKWSSDGTEIIGITEIGRSTVAALKLNNELSIATRRFWVLLGEFLPL